MPDQISKRSKSAEGIVERLDVFTANGSGHRTLAERAFQMLHDAIVSGALQPGERLPIEDLARAMEMSPMPIREALRRLDGVGLVENIPHRGARVTDLSVEDLKDVYNSRLLLEVAAISRAAEHFDDEERAKAREAFDGLGKALENDPREEVLQAHTDFHFSLYEAASSRWLLRLISPLWNSAERYRVAATSGPSNELLMSRMEEHKRLLAACENQRPDLAAVELWNHLTRTANMVSKEMGGGELYQFKPVVDE
ncbi:MAG: GntR family transcriptional regulator [Solirubrobacterales bacterium]